MTKQIKTYELFDVVGGMGAMGEHPEGKWILKKDHEEIVEKLVEALKFYNFECYAPYCQHDKCEDGKVAKEVLKELGEL